VSDLKQADADADTERLAQEETSRPDTGAIISEATAITDTGGRAVSLD
jgi:hypothetical protein